MNLSKIKGSWYLRADIPYLIGLPGKMRGVQLDLKKKMNFKYMFTNFWKLKLSPIVSTFSICQTPWRIWITKYFTPNPFSKLKFRAQNKSVLNTEYYMNGMKLGWIIDWRRDATNNEMNFKKNAMPSKKRFKIWKKSRKPSNNLFLRSIIWNLSRFWKRTKPLRDSLEISIQVPALFLEVSHLSKNSLRRIRSLPNWVYITPEIAGCRLTAT